MKRIFSVLCLLMVVPVFFVSSLSAEDKEKSTPNELKVSGMVIAHPDKQDVKVARADFKNFTINVDKNTKITARVRVKLEDMWEPEVIEGTVTYIEVDGKLIATKIEYTSNDKGWKNMTKRREE